MSSPAHDALERIEYAVNHGKQAHPTDVATVRERLDTLAAQVERLSSETSTEREHRLLNETRRLTIERDAAEAQVEQLTQERDAALDREAGTHDALDDLRLENDALTLNARATDHARKTDNSYLIARAESAEAENARLTALLETTREGLRELESAVSIFDVMLRETADAEDYHAYFTGAWFGVDEAAEKARALLAASSPPPGDTGCRCDGNPSGGSCAYPDCQLPPPTTEELLGSPEPQEGDTEPDGGGAK